MFSKKKRKGQISCDLPQSAEVGAVKAQQTGKRKPPFKEKAPPNLHQQRLNLQP